jgi:hypothetical protein
MLLVLVLVLVVLVVLQQGLHSPPRPRTQAQEAVACRHQLVVLAAGVRRAA